MGCVSFSVTFTQVISLVLGIRIQKVHFSVESTKIPCALGYHIEIFAKYFIVSVPSIHVEICLLLN